MKKVRKKKQPVSAEQIERLADQGKDISGFFTNRGRVMRPIQAVDQRYYRRI